MTESTLLAAMKTETLSAKPVGNGANWENLLELWNDRIQKSANSLSRSCHRFRTINVNHTQTSTPPFPLPCQDQSACVLLLITLTFNHPSLLSLLDNTLSSHAPRAPHPALSSLLPLLLDVSTRMESRTQQKLESEENQLDEQSSLADRSPSA